MEEPMRTKDKIALVIVASLWLAAAFCVLLLIFAPPVQAATWGDDFSTDTSALYNYTPTSGVWTWDTANGRLWHNNSVNAPNRSIIRNPRFGYGKYSVDIRIGTAGTGRVSGLQFGGQTNISSGVAYASSATGNHYAATISTTTNVTQMTRVVAGASTNLKSYTVIPPGIDTVNYHNIGVLWNSTGGIGLTIDGVFYGSAIDTAFSNGYAGVFRGSAFTINNFYDNLFINETPVSGFFCYPLSGSVTVTCTQTIPPDPGTTALWSWYDGSTSSNETGIHTYTVPGTYSVTLTNTNVAGSSSTTQPDYLDIPYSPDAPIAGFNMILNDTSTNMPTSWNWTAVNLTGNQTEFRFSTEKNPAWNLTTGNWRIKLTAGNVHGSNSTVHNIGWNLSSPRVYFWERVG